MLPNLNVIICLPPFFSVAKPPCPKDRKLFFLGWCPGVRRAVLLPVVAWGRHFMSLPKLPVSKKMSCYRIMTIILYHLSFSWKWIGAISQPLSPAAPKIMESQTSGWKVLGDCHGLPSIVDYWAPTGSHSTSVELRFGISCPLELQADEHFCVVSPHSPGLIGRA